MVTNTEFPLELRKKALLKGGVWAETREEATEIGEAGTVLWENSACASRDVGNTGIFKKLLSVHKSGVLGLLAQNEQKWWDDIGFECHAKN